MNTLFEKFNASLKTGTPAEKRLARYYLEHPGDISYETAAHVADKLDLSPMTVGRFLRSMEIDPQIQLPGMRNGAAARGHDRTHANPGFAETAQRDIAPARDHMDALRQAQAISGESNWRLAVDNLSRANEVFVTSLGQMQAMSVYFASRLSYVRDGVRHLSGLDGTYVELLGNNRTNCLLTILDDRQATGRLQRLSVAARQAGHRVLLFTHSHAPDLDGICDVIIRGPMQGATGCLDPVALTAMIETAVAAVSAAQGPFAAERAGRIAELQRYFSEHA